jgi:tetratricopeptide (TPR) repeat protein
VPARQGLARLYVVALDRSALEAHYLRETEASTHPLHRLRAFLRLGALFDGAGNDPVSAAAAYESALEVMEDQPDALRALVALLRRMGNWDRLAALLARIAGTARDRGAAVVALKEWASIVELHLSEKWDPAPIYERILEAEPNDLTSMLALESLAYEREDGAVIVALARRQIGLGGDPDLVAALATRAAAFLLSWGKYDEAGEVLRGAVDQAPHYLPAVRILRAVDERVGEWGEAAELLLREADLARSPQASQAALLRAGNIFFDRFGDEDRARAAFERVFAKDPAHSAAFGRLASILGAATEWTSLIKLYRRRMEVLDPETRVPLQMELAALLRDNLGDASGAFEVLREVLALEPAYRQALTEIAALSVREERWRDAEEYLERLAQAEKDEPATRKDTMLRRADILQERLGEEEQAMAVLAQLLAEFPGERTALVRCMMYYQRRENWEKAVEVLEELARTGAPGDRINHLVNLAEIFSRSLNEPERARAALRKATTLCVDGAVGVDRISEYFERRGDFESLVDFLDEALESLPPEGAPGAVAVRLARARVLAGRLLRPKDAESEIRRALQSDPTSISARLELAGLHLWGDNLGEAIAEYLRVLEQEPFSVEAFRGLYRVYERRGDMERAAGAAQAVCAVAGKEVPERKIAVQATAPMEAMLASAVATPLGVSDFWSIVAHHDEPRPARELLFHVADLLPQIYPSEVERSLGRTFVSLNDEDQLAQRVGQLARVLGVDRFETCIGQNLSACMVTLPGVPPRLVVDDAFAAAASPAEFRFAAGRALAAVLTRSLYLAALAPRSVELLLATVVELFDKGYSGYLGQRVEAETLLRVVNRAVSRKLRKLLEEPARAYAAGQPVAAAAWYVASQRSGERAGLLLAGDLEAALAVLSREKAGRAVQAEMLRFSVGSRFYEARRRLGLSI